MADTMLHNELIFLNYEASSQEDLLKKFSNVLYRNGYVKESYAQAIINREAQYPTGLNTPGIKLAMPHTFPQHVLKPAILVATLKRAIPFKEMGNSSNNIDAKLIFMLAVTDPKGHLAVLSKLMSIFSDKDKLLDIYNSNDKNAIIEKLNKILL